MRHNHFVGGEERMIDDSRGINILVLHLIIVGKLQAPVDECRKPGFDAASCISGTTWPTFVKVRTTLHLYTARLGAAR